ncbi:MAG: hypothetical protein CSA62_09510 [Planctomycetota bacterium]|nr:MAG: hypothetical protein CSA62_09510 [Planctomycetota bacterium]
MNIGRLQPSEPGGRKGPKVEQARDGKILDARKLRVRRASSFDPQDSVSFSHEAIELRAELEGFVEQLRRREQQENNDLDPERLAEIRKNLENGHYEQAAVRETVARRMHSSWNKGFDGMALPSE